MSYILEALKKSDQQRQRGTTPSLASSQETATETRQGFSIYYVLIAAVLLFAGIAIGLLHPWQAEQPDHATEPIAAKATMTTSDRVKPIPQSDQSAISGNKDQKLSPPDSMPTVQVAQLKQDTSAPLSPKVASAVVPAPTITLNKHANSADAVQAQKAVPIDELPVTIQQEIPNLKIQLHSYSSNPVNSLVSINSRMMKEGESLMPGLKLEQIVPDGVIFSYKGYRFRKGMF